MALQRGSSVTRNINPYESHLFEVDLQAEQLITLYVFAADLNFTLRLIGPDGNIRQEVTHRRYGDLAWQFVAPERGLYRLTITSLELTAQPREYQLKVEQIRAATQHEKNSVRAAAEFYQAEVLRFGRGSDELRRAIEKYRLAGLAWRRQEQWAEATVAWQRLGDVHFIQGAYRDALNAYEESWRLSWLSDDIFLTLEQLNNIGYIHLYLGNIKKAARYFEQVRAQLGKVSVGRTSTRQRTEARLENNFGEVEYARGNLKNSLELFARARALWEAVGDRQGIALARLNAGYSHLDSGGVTEAATELEQSLRLWREVGDWRGEALTLTARGNLQALLGDRYTALTSHHTARAIFRNMGDRQGEAITLNGLGDVFEDLNLKQEAIDNYSFALRLNHLIGNKDSEAVGNYYLGRIYRNAGDFPQALTYYEASLTLSRQTGKPRMVMHVLMDIAAIYTKQQKYTDALRLYHQSLTFYERIGDLRRLALIRHGLGDLRRSRGEPEQAAREYHEGLELFRRIKDPQGEAESRYWLAKLLQEQGRWSEALRESEESIELIEDQRARVLGQNWRSSYFASVHRYFELYVDILMHLHRQSPERGFAALALQASERARARSLLELLNETGAEIRRGVDPSLLARERLLRQQLSAKTAYRIQTLNAGPTEAEIAEIELELRHLNSEYDFIQAQIKAKSPAYAQLIRPSILSLAEIQSALKEDEGTVLIEYLLGDERSYVWLVTADDLISQELPGRRVIETMAGEVYRALTARQKQPGEEPARYYARYTGAEDKFCQHAGQLSRLILGPLEMEAAGKSRRLLVVADGDLQYIPFEALPLPGAAVEGCRLGVEPPAYLPLLTTHEVIHLPSFSSLALLRRLDSSSPPRAEGIAIWADPVFEADDPRVVNGPIPGAEGLESELGKQSVFNVRGKPPPRLLATREEAKGIQRLSPAGAVLLFMDFAATRESALERDLSGYRILHFATHGFIDSRHPSLSGLLLSTINEQGHGSNGLLQLHDIYGLRLNADLVVLSACQTGIGENLSGEGFVGLTQGFLYAGSRSIVVSLWQVEDNTAATLMTNFYHAMLKEGEAPAVALRRAKLTMYRQGALQSPYYWSAFVIQGEFRAPPPTWREMIQTWLLWGVSAVLAVILWLCLRRSRRRLAACL
jgi:CHAT domain-containing protein/tetratricopeptide (TPR) repeat protein